MKPVIIDQQSYGILCVTGADRVRFIHGMCTANINSLKEGQWVRACILSAKGRVIGLSDVVARRKDLLLLTEPDQVDSLNAHLAKHVIMDDVEISPSQVTLHRVWDSPEAVWTAEPKFEEFEESETSESLEPSSPEDIETRRIEAGLPRYGVDVTEANFPFESPLIRTVDTAKGCYIGQEPVARVMSRGAANKQLRGFALSGPVKPGAAIAHAERAQAGVVTSVATSTQHGPIALGYLHRDVAEPGGQVTLGDVTATVIELPFAQTS